MKATDSAMTREERDAAMVQMALAGHSFEDVGRAYGLTGVRVQQVVRARTGKRGRDLLPLRQAARVERQRAQREARAQSRATLPTCSVCGRRAGKAPSNTPFICNHTKECRAARMRRYTKTPQQQAYWHAYRRSPNGIARARAAFQRWAERHPRPCATCGAPTPKATHKYCAEHRPAHGGYGAAQPLSLRRKVLRAVARGQTPWAVAKKFGLPHTTAYTWVARYGSTA